QVDVELKFELTSDLAANVSRQLIDCAIIGGPAPSHISNLNEIHLAKHSLYLAVSLTHSFKDKVSITLGECHQEKFIIADTQTANGYTTAVMSAFRRADLYPDVITNIFPTDMILNMVADNIGISLVSRESALHRQDIRLIPIKPPPFINISLIQPSEARPIVETFVSMMVAKERQ
ncbi:MAG: LysR family transcriptional regulator substrate-binding protein, partial [Pseudomonadota bacterium]